MKFLKSLTAWLQIRKIFNGFQLKISLYRRGNLLIFIANATTKVTYRKLAIQFGQCKSSRQKLAAKVVKTELKLYFRYINESTTSFRYVYCFVIFLKHSGTFDSSCSSPDQIRWLLNFLARLHSITFARILNLAMGRSAVFCINLSGTFASFL